MKDTLDIRLARNESGLTVELRGPLDAPGAQRLERTLEKAIDDIESAGDGKNGVGAVVLDFAGVSFLSSAGLRALLILRKRLIGSGEVRLRNVDGSVLDVLRLTGFTTLFTIDDRP